jgi:hypothetical protein
MKREAAWNSHASFWVTAACLGGFLVIYSFAYAPVVPILSPDSYNYVQPLIAGSFNTTRSIGYPVFVLVVAKLGGFAILPWVQLLAQVLSYVVAAWLLSRAYNSFFLGIFALLGLCLQGVMTLNAPQVLTESLFIAALTLFAGAIAASARRADSLNLALVGVGLVLAVAAKAVGIVLVVPAVLLLRFVPRHTRMKGAALAILPGVAVYLAMSAHGYARSGTFSPEQFAGYALGGHVGWMLDGEIEGQPGVAERTRAAAALVTAKRPADLEDIRSLSDLDRYVIYTSNEYNELLWVNMVPSLGAPSNKAANDALLALSISSIKRRPLAYLGHVAAHFYGLWTMVGHAPTLPDAAVLVREYAAESPSVSYSVFGGLANPLPHDAVRRAVQAQTSVPLIGKEFLVWVGQASGGRAMLIMAAFTIAISLLFLMPGWLGRMYRGEIVLALSLNAYLLGQALFQVALSRYSTVIFPALFLFFGCFLATTLSGVARYSLARVAYLNDLTKRPKAPD